MSCSCVFFFQAEDGIRDLVRSRGLGDVYKRQEQDRVDARKRAVRPCGEAEEGGENDEDRDARLRPVSYTHLTLPTSDLV